MQAYEHLELLLPDQFPEHTSSLSITNNPTPKVILLRGLVGSIKIKHTLSQTEFYQNVDYFDIENKNSEINPIERLCNYISQDLSQEEVGKIFIDKKFLYQNLHFFNRLINEFSNYYYYEKKESHTTAFAYLYRILETISYSFPLIYASKSDDFKGTYIYLKEWLASEKGDKGERAFFKSFIKTVFDKGPFFKTNITINILAETEEIQKIFYKSFVKACPDPKIFAEEDTQEPHTISVKFSEYSSFIICLRNRFFHLLNSGQPNLESDDILDSDHFFKLVNRQTAYWLSVVLLEVLKRNID